MTLDELLDKPIDYVEKVTDEELIEICKQYFNVTRPSLVRAAREQKQQPQVYISPQKLEQMNKMKEMGIDLFEIMNRKKRKK